MMTLLSHLSRNLIRVRRTSTYPVTRPSNPARTNDRLVGGADGDSGRRDGIDISRSQFL